MEITKITLWIMSVKFSLNSFPSLVLIFLAGISQTGFAKPEPYPNCKPEDLHNVASGFAYTAMSGGHEYTMQNTIHSNSDSAVDGKKDVTTKKVLKSNCALTLASDSGPNWWQVELQNRSSIEKVVVSSLDNKTYETDFVVVVEDERINALEIGYPSYVDWSKICDRISYTEFNCGRRIGYYVWIVGLANKEKPLILCEVEVYARTPLDFNIAYLKRTKQSSIDLKADSFFAVDGSVPLYNYFYHHRTMGPQCTHTNNEGESFPWWRVDLEVEFLVDRVVLYNRGEGLHTYLHDVEIRIGSYDIPNDYVNGTKHFTDNPLCESEVNRFIQEGVNVALCKKPLKGRYVSVQIATICPGRRKCPHFTNILVLCEVEVYGEPLHNSRPLQLVSRGNWTQQSSTDLFGDSSLAVDGKIPNSAFSSISIETCVRTPPARHPWWQVSMWELFLIEEVIIYLPGGGNSSRLHDFEILVGRTDLRRNFASSGYKSNRNIVCTTSTTRNLPQGQNRFKCKNPLVGSDVAIRIVDDKRRSINILNICEVEVMGCQISDGILNRLFEERANATIANK